MSYDLENFTTDDYHFMNRSIQLARSGWYTTRPNPRVGCVLVKSGKIIGEGYHIRAGLQHAECNALQQAGTKAKGSTAYVSLEPCSHYGRTPPCAQLLIDSGVIGVTAAMMDPNPLVSGKGLVLMEKAGLVVRHGLLQSAAMALNEGFIKRMRTNIPFIRVKLAMSLDGCTAMKHDKSQWITGAYARKNVQQLRAASCAIITGVDSILHDDSSLNVRDATALDIDLMKVKQPLRVVLDSRLRTPLTAKVITLPGSCLIVTTQQSANLEKKTLLEQAGAEVLVQKSNDCTINLYDLMIELGARSCNEVLVETGSTLAGAMVKAKLVDEIVLFIAPILMGSNTQPLLKLPFISFAEKQHLAIKDIRMFDNDIRITARFVTQ